MKEDIQNILYVHLIVIANEAKQSRGNVGCMNSVPGYLEFTQ